MGHSIEFTDFRIEKSSFSCKVKSSRRDKTDILEFMLSPEVKYLDRDAIACSMASLCGTAYEKVTLDIPVSVKCRKQLEKFTNAQWQTKTSGINWHAIWTVKKPERYILNFSGGFDSLAAVALLPQDKCALVSVDFGGGFEREAKFFREFNPYTLKTNFRQRGYDKESWTFMGCGSMLFAKHLKAKYHIFGTIFEATIFHFREGGPKESHLAQQPFAAAGLRNIQLMNGITEVGTAMIMTKYFPELVGKSLISLAAPTSEKRYRKQTLTEIVCERYGHDLTLPECPMPDPKHIQAFGKNLAMDFLAIYELKHRGAELVSRTVADIPEEAIELANRLNLNFYEHLNTKFMVSIPDSLRPYYLSRLEECGVVPYTEEDWKEYNEVRNFLGKYHPAIMQ